MQGWVVGGGSGEGQKRCHAQLLSSAFLFHLFTSAVSSTPLPSFIPSRIMETDGVDFFSFPLFLSDKL